MVWNLGYEVNKTCMKSGMWTRIELKMGTCEILTNMVFGLMNQNMVSLSK